MSKIVGIDLGTTNSLVAMVDSGIPLVIADADGSRLTPSVVQFTAIGAPPMVGHPAKRARALRPAETVSSVKRFMGRRWSELAPDETAVGFPLRKAEDGAIAIELHGRLWSPEEVSAEILKKLRTVAESALGEEITRAVITVPAYFNDAQRNATKRAGELAGFTVERIVNEPTAAALAYGLHRLRDHSRIAVYDLGGGTFDLSILELREGVFQVLATSGNTRLGGDDLDRRVTEHLASEIIRLGGDDPTKSPLIHARLKEAAEEAKIRLSIEDSVEIALPFLGGEKSFSITLTREKLESLTRDLIESTRQHCLRSLSDARLEATELDQVILVGGQTRMPLVRRLVSQWFGCAEFDETRGDLRLGTEYHTSKGPALNTSQNPDEAVALGAAVQAAILEGSLSGMVLLDVTPLSLGIETFGGLMNVIIPRNSTIPVKAGEVFTTAVDHQREVLIHVLQGERERARDNWSLGKFTLDFPPAPRGVPRVGVQFEIDANGILHVLARDIATGHQKLLELKSAVDVEDTQVQQMVEEAVDHAFTDMDARRWIEARLRAKETADAARKSLDAAPGKISAESVESIRTALAALDALLKMELETPGEADIRALKAAHAAVDEATQPLAEILMDEAVEALLKARGILP